MKAAVGDQLVILGRLVDHPVRDGEILEVRGPDGAPPYLVRWSDTGREALVFPGPDARVRHLHTEHRPGEPSGTTVAAGV